MKTSVLIFVTPKNRCSPKKPRTGLYSLSPPPDAQTSPSAKYYSFPEKTGGDSNSSSIFSFFYYDPSLVQL